METMEYVQLRSFDNYIEANIVLNMLRHYNINCHLKDENIITIDPFLSPAIGGMKLMVHHAHVERAWDMMDKAEQEYLKSIACPVCKAHALTTISVTKQHKCKLGALAYMLLHGDSVEVKKIYKCTACGYDFKELPGNS
jgi:DNA-directed RNA polymerase subunit M/transcription elongation factor TFIIS